MDLSANDLTNIACFTQSAANLGLIEKSTDKLIGFLQAAAAVGGLAPGRITIAIAFATAVASSGLLAANASVERVASLLNNAKALGINTDNVYQQVTSIVEAAEQYSIHPFQQKPEAPALDGTSSHHSLKLAPYECIDILEVAMIQSFNECTRLYIKGALAAGIDNKTVQEIVPGAAATLINVKEHGKEVIFTGVITKIKQFQVVQRQYLEAELICPGYNQGMPEGQETKEISAAAYTVQKDLEGYRTFLLSGANCPPGSFRDANSLFKIESNDRLQVGDVVKWLNHTLYISAVYTILERGALKHRYTLVKNKGANS